MNENLIKAAEYIDEHGWTQGEYQDNLGRVCLLGAIHQVVPDAGKTFYNVDISHLGAFLDSKYHMSCISIINDTILKSGDEASKVLREAAEWDFDGA